MRTPDLLEGLSAKFSSKPPAKKAKEGETKNPLSKKFKELKGSPLNITVEPIFGC